MDSWKQRFEYIIYELYNEDPPFVIRSRELDKIIFESLIDEIFELANTVLEKDVRSNYIPLTDSFIQEILEDGRFCTTSGLEDYENEI